MNKRRLKDLGAPLEMPGAELAEVPVIGPIVFGFMFLILVLVLVILVGGFLIAFAEVIVIGAIALGSWLWAWMRGHPKMVLLEVDDHQWVRPAGSEVKALEHARLVRRGADPASLGYEPLAPLG